MVKLVVGGRYIRILEINERINGKNVLAQSNRRKQNDGT
jgi:hypothetical protein